MTPSTPELLAEMARLTTLSGRISDLQEKNLKLFPMVFFNDVQECKIDYDLSHKQDVLEDTEGKLIINTPTKNHYVAYYLTLNETSNAFNLDKRYTALEQSVRTLFWSDVVVEIYLNGQIKYKSMKV